MRTSRILPTQLVITDSAKQIIKKFHDDEKIPLAIEAIKSRVETPGIKPLTRLQKLFLPFKSTNQLTVRLGYDANGEFFITSVRKLNEIILSGKKVTLNLFKVPENIEVFDRALLKSKQGILENLQIYQNAKKIFRI